MEKLSKYIKFHGKFGFKNRTQFWLTHHNMFQLGFQSHSAPQWPDLIWCVLA